MPVEMHIKADTESVGRMLQRIDQRRAEPTSGVVHCRTGSLEIDVAHQRGQRRVFTVITDPRPEYELGWTAMTTSGLKNIR